MSGVINVNGLTKKFGSTDVLNGIDLAVKSGEVLVIIGPSGSGKSTLLRCLNLLEKPSSGVVRILDLEITAKGFDLPTLRNSTSQESWC